MSSTVITNQDDLGSQILVASWTLASVSAIFLFMRCFAKIWTNRGLWVDDYILILAWLCVLAPAILSTVAVGKGFGMHIYNIPPERVLPLSMLINSIVTVLILASALSKTSFVLTVLRFVTGWMRWAAWFILISTNVLFGINIILVWLIFNPNPVPTTSTPPPPMAPIVNPLQIYGIAVTAYSAIMDIALVGMAWIVVSKLQMRSKREKFGVGIAMSMGIIAGATSIVKATIFPTLSDGDITFTSASLHIWSIVEPAITIIAASIPMLRIIFAHVKQMATQNSTRIGMGNPEYGPDTTNGRRKGSGSVSVVTVSNNDGPRRTPYVDKFQSSEEILMLETLQAPHVRTENSSPPRVVEDGGEAGAEQARSTFLYI